MTPPPARSRSATGTRSATQPTARSGQRTGSPGTGASRMTAEAGSSVLLAVRGFFNLIYGISEVARSHAFVGKAH